jgi:hypothetical protein
MTPYEARCAAYWLFTSHGYLKSHAARAVGRGRGNPTFECKWMGEYVLDLFDRSVEKKQWKSRNKEAIRERDRRYQKLKKMPYYKFLKQEIGDLRALPTLKRSSAK